MPNTASEPGRIVYLEPGEEFSLVASGGRSRRRWEVEAHPRGDLRMSILGTVLSLFALFAWWW